MSKIPPTSPRKHILLAFHWYSEALHEGALKYCVERGWDTSVLNTDSVGNIAPGSFDGVIGMLPPAGHPVFEFVAASGAPVVDLSYAHPEFARWVRCPSDGTAVGAMAAEYLRRRPVSSFLFTAFSEWPNHVARRNGFLNTLAATGDGRPVFVHHTNASDDPRFESRLDTGSPDSASTSALAEYLKTLPRPVGVFGSVDNTARQVLDAARQANLSVPGDIYLMGFGNRELVCRISPVPITSIAIDYVAWAYAAADLLAGLMTGRVAPGTVRLFPPSRVIERESTGGESGGDPLCARAIDLMRANISEPLDVPQLARALGVSGSTLKRAFSEAYGMGVAKRYLLLRLEIAKGLLLSGEKVESVAGAVGFASVRAFRSAFMNQVGKAPRKYAGKKTESPAK